MKKYGAIDLGTNSMRLLLAQVQEGKITSRRKEINPTRIGKSVDQSGNITPEGFRENLEAFEAFVQKARAYGAKEVYAMATSAVRDASNGREFIKQAFQRTGINIEIIDGQNEGVLGYKGVLMGLEKDTSDLLVMDIGGGSTEFIIGKGEVLEEIVSKNVGAVRLTERIITTDPITPGELKSLRLEIQKEINQTLKLLKEKNIKKLIGIGGTITTLAALHQELEIYDMDKVHNYRLRLQDIEAIYAKLNSLTIAERKGLKGIHPKRVDIIVAGVAILLITMETIGIEEITVSEYDNLEGLISHKHILAKEAGPY